MYGKITFKSIEELVEFLAAWQKTSNTAVFEITNPSTNRWVLEFTGGY